MSFTAWLSLFTISLLGAISPGPSLVVVSKNALSGGKISGIVTAWSHACGIGIYALLSMLGLSVLLQKYPNVFTALTYLGALYLLYLGIGAIRSKNSSIFKLQKDKKMPLLKSMLDGILISVLNPKIAIFFIALFSQFMHQESSVNDKIITTLTPFLTDGMWYTLVSLILSKEKIFIYLRKNALFVDRAIGIVLIALAFKILFT